LGACDTAGGQGAGVDSRLPFMHHRPRSPMQQVHVVVQSGRMLWYRAGTCCGTEQAHVVVQSRRMLWYRAGACCGTEQAHVVVQSRRALV